MSSDRFCDECGGDLRYCEKHDLWHHEASFEIECSDILYAYTDRKAVEDGVLVDISNLGLSFRFRLINRMTSHLYAELEPFLEPYEFEFDGDPAWKEKALRKILRTKLSYAWYEGDIWHLPPKLWLMENEVGGWTVMFPEDY